MSYAKAGGSEGARPSTAPTQGQSRRASARPEEDASPRLTEVAQKADPMDRIDGMMTRLQAQSRRRNQWRNQWVKSEHVHKYDPSKFGGPPRTPDGMTVRNTPAGGPASTGGSVQHYLVGAPSRWLRDPAARSHRADFMGKPASPPPRPAPPDTRSEKAKQLDEYIDTFWKPKLRKRARRKCGGEREDPPGEAAANEVEERETTRAKEKEMEEDRVEEEEGGDNFKYTTSRIKGRRRKRGKERWGKGTRGARADEALLVGQDGAHLIDTPPNDTLSKHVPGFYLSGEVRANETEYLANAGVDPREVQIDVMFSSAGSEGARVAPRSKARRKVRKQIGRAVTVLNRYWRGALVRWMLFRQAEAALRLQTQMRRKLGENELAKRRKPHDCARAIQAGWRYHIHWQAMNAKVRADYFAWRRQRDEASCVMQKAARYRARRKEGRRILLGRRRDIGAVRIQAVHRQRQDARRVQAMRQERGEQHAATVLQRRQRGTEGRRVATQRRAGRDAVVKLQARCRRKQVAPIVEVRRAEVEAQHEAAVMVQCSVRSHLAVKNVASRRQLKWDEEARERNAAATLIQGPVRRRKAVALAEEKREQRNAAALLQSVARRSAARVVVNEKRAQNEAATKLQTIARSRTSVRVVDSKRQEKRKREVAATKLAGAARRRQACVSANRKRQENRDRAEAATRLQSVARSRKARQAVGGRREARRQQNVAAAKLQNAARARQARAVVSEKRARRGGAIVIQSQFRVRKAEQESGRRRQQAVEERASLKLQASARGWEARRRVAELMSEARDREAAMVLQCATRSRAARVEVGRVRARATQAELENVSALRIQSKTRQRWAQAEVGARRQQKQEAAAVTLQSSIRTRRSKVVVNKKRQERREQNEAALHLQASTRKRQARAAVELRREENRVKSEAASKLQNGERSRQARREVQRRRAAAAAAAARVEAERVATESEAARIAADQERLRLEAETEEEIRRAEAEFEAEMTEAAAYDTQEAICNRAAIKIQSLHRMWHYRYGDEVIKRRRRIRKSKRMVEEMAAEEERKKLEESAARQVALEKARQDALAAEKMASEMAKARLEREAAAAAEEEEARERARLEIEKERAQLALEEARARLEAEKERIRKEELAARRKAAANEAYARRQRAATRLQGWARRALAKKRETPIEAAVEVFDDMLSGDGEEGGDETPPKKVVEMTSFSTIDDDSMHEVLGAVPSSAVRKEGSIEEDGEDSLEKDDPVIDIMAFLSGKKAEDGSDASIDASSDAPDRAPAVEITAWLDALEPGARLGYKFGGVMQAIGLESTDDFEHMDAEMFEEVETDLADAGAAKRVIDAVADAIKNFSHASAIDLAEVQEKKENFDKRRRASVDARRASVAAREQLEKVTAGDEWTVHVDPSTQLPYYHNSVTGETTWEDPRAKPAQSAVAQPAATQPTQAANFTSIMAKPQPQPQTQPQIQTQTQTHIEVHHDPHGQPYYFNASTGVTTWEAPPDLAEAAAVAARAAEAAEKERQRQQLLSAQVTLAPGQAQAHQPYVQTSSGRGIVHLTMDMGVKFGWQRGGDSLLIKKVTPGGQASQVGVKIGWEIVDVAGQSVNNTATFNAAVAQLKAAGNTVTQVTFKTAGMATPTRQSANSGSGHGVQQQQQGLQQQQQQQQGRQGQHRASTIEMHTDPQGRTYYYDTATGTTTWEPPPGFVPQRQQQQQQPQQSHQIFQHGSQQSAASIYHQQSYQSGVSGYQQQSGQMQQAPTVSNPWQVSFDEKYGVPYYHNTVTGESSWEKPADYDAYENASVRGMANHSGSSVRGVPSSRSQQAAYDSDDSYDRDRGGYNLGL